MQIWNFLISKKDDIVCFLALAIFASLFAPGHAVESIAVMVMVGYALLLLLTGQETIGVHPRLFWLFIAYYGYLIVTGLWAEDMGLFIEKIRIKSVLVGLPFSFLVFKSFTPRQFRIFTYGFVAMVMGSVIYVVYSYYHNFEIILKEMLEGHPIPVPFRSHVRFSIMVNIALMLAMHRANILSINRLRIQYVGWVFIAFLLFIFTQFLAVKVGMVIAYISIICFTIHKILQTRNFMWGVSIIGISCLVSVLILSRFPTVKNKIAYLKYDMQQFRLKDTKNYSDGSRIVSVKKGIDILKEHPWLGVGEGNVANYLTKDGNGEVKLPHNQFILTWAQNGIIGFLLLILIFSSSIFLSIRDKNWLLATMTFAFFFACMVEAMLETQIGVAVFTLTWVLFASLTNVYRK